MLWVFTDYHYSTLTLDNSALIADWFYRWSYFHLVSASFGKIYLCLNGVEPDGDHIGRDAEDEVHDVAQASAHDP